MQKWTRIKQENAPADISALVDQMLKKKRTAQNEGPNYNNNQSQEDREAKLKVRRERREAKRLKMEQEAKDSYLNVEQFTYMQTNIEMAGKRLKEQQVYINQMEEKMIE